MNRRCPVCGTEYPDAIAFCGQDGNVTIRVVPDGEQADSRLGEKLGEYIVAVHVADGGMGAVYEARNAGTRERVAIKVLHTEIEQDEVAVERFKREYETADMFEHPHIVKVIDFGETLDGQHYMTMEFLQGLELGELVRTTGAQTPARTIRVLAQIALALDEAHGFGVIHRDLKPDNVYLCRSDAGDDVRILDFGSVKLQVETGPKLTAFGTTLGSPYYMSPEQAKGLPDVDTRTDVFAMGAICYEMLSGKIAFEAPSVAEILMKIVRMMPDPIETVAEGTPPGLGDVIEKAIAKDKLERHGTPIEFVDALLKVYGVEGTVEEWAQKSQDELAAALAVSAAPAPMVDAPVVDAPVVDEPGVDEPVVDEPVVDEPVVDERGGAAPGEDAPIPATPVPAAPDAAAVSQPAGSLPPPGAYTPTLKKGKSSNFMLFAGIAFLLLLVFGCCVALAAVKLM